MSSKAIPVLDGWVPLLRHLTESSSNAPILWRSTGLNISRNSGLEFISYKHGARPPFKSGEEWQCPLFHSRCHEMLVQGVGLILSSKKSWGHAQTHLLPSRSLLTRTTLKLICPRNTLHSSSFCCTTLHKRISEARDCRKTVSEPKSEYGCTERKRRISQKEKMCPTTVCGCFGVAGEDSSLLLHPWMGARGHLCSLSGLVRAGLCCCIVLQLQKERWTASQAEKGMARSSMGLCLLREKKGLSQHNFFSN